LAVRFVADVAWGSGAELARGVSIEVGRKKIRQSKRNVKRWHASVTKIAVAMSPGGYIQE
jgi:hypothetical protein